MAYEYHKLWPASVIEEATVGDLDLTAVTQVDLYLEDPDPVPVPAADSEVSSSCSILDKLRACTKSDLAKKVQN